MSKKKNGVDDWEDVLLCELTRRHKEHCEYTKNEGNGASLASDDATHRKNCHREQQQERHQSGSGGGEVEGGNGGETTRELRERDE